ncbi:MAG: hypothetical protein ABI836_13225 [Gemmatimonadota bacterium]
MPFRVIGSGPEAQLLRDGMVDLLYIHLDGFAGLKLVNPTTVIARTTARPPGDLRSTAALAREMGAGTMVTGNAIQIGDEVRLLAEVYDATTLERRTSVQLQGSPSQIIALVDSLAWSLARYRLIQHPGAVRRPATEYTTGSLPALRAYLAGEQLARESQWQQAMDSLKRATALDSLFGLAWYGQYRVALWGGQGDEDEQEILIQNGLRSPRLGQRQRDVLLAVEALQRGTRVEALERERILAERYPQDPDATLARGEILYHVGLPAGIPVRQALTAFETVIALDSRAVEGYGHAIELLCQVNDPAGAWRLLLAAPGRPATFKPYELALRVAFRGESAASILSGPESTAARAASGGASFRMSRMLNGDPVRSLALADSFLLALFRIRNREPIVIERYQRLLAQGQMREAWQIISQMLARNHDGLVLANAATPVRLRGSDTSERHRMADSLAVQNFWAPWIAIAWWATLDGDTLKVDSAVSALRSYAGWPPLKYREALGAGLRGLAFLAIGDTLRARTSLAAGLETRYYQMGSAWATLMPTVVFALELARLELASNEVEAARRRLSDGLTHLDEELPYRAEALELLGEIAERQGDTTTAIRSYRTFIALWQHADPELQPRVAAARTALGRLTIEPGHD